MNVLQTRTSAVLRRWALLPERRPWLGAAFLLLVYVPCVLLASRQSPLSHDELFTGYISGAPNLRELWAGLRGFDLNPPLSYWLTRLTLPLDGHGALGLRLPEMVAFAAFLLLLFEWVRRRLGTGFGVFAAMLLMGSVLWELAFLARPYALMLAFLALAMVLWQGLEGRQVRRGWRLAGLAAAVTAMLLCHVFGVLALAGLAGAEFYRARHRGRADWPVMGVLLLPLIVVAAYVPMLRTHDAALYPPAFQPSGTMIFEFAIGSVERELVTLGLTGLAVLLLLGPRHLRTGGRRWFFSAPEWCLTVLFLVLPLCLMGALMAVHGAFFARYGAPANVGVALVATALLARWTLWEGKPDQRAAWLGTVVILLTSGLASAWPRALAEGVLLPTRAHSEPAVLPCQACLRTAASGLQLVDASGLTFVQMTHYEPSATLTRLYYLTDPEASRDFAHANIFERMGDVVRHVRLPGHAGPYAAFTREHPHFFVLGRYSYPEDWLLRKLVADGADVRRAGTVHDSYREDELWEVRVSR